MITKSKIIPVNRPKIYSSNNLQIKKALKQKWISGDGPIVDKFEKIFAKKIGTKYAISLTNGTSALEIAIASLKLNKGDCVMVPNLTIISCLNAILKNNLKPIFVDVDIYDYNVCIKDLKKKISKKIKAIIMVHTYGLASNINEIIKLKKKYNFKIIEDCAEGIGLKYKKNF
jgi:perosamine synthetase